MQREITHNPFDNWSLSPSGLYLPSTMARPAKPMIAVDLFAGAGGMSLGLLQAGIHVVAACDNNADAAITYLHNLGAYPLQMHFLSSEDEKRMEKALKRSMSGKDGQIKTASVSGSNRPNLQDMPPGWNGVAHYFFGDVRKLTGQMVLDALGVQRGQVDLVCGGPPCQGFSKAGKQDVMDPRNSLVFDFVRIVLEIFPKSMVMEEVPEVANMVTPDGINVLDAVCRALEDGGFGVADRLKRSLATTAGVGAVLRGNKTKKTNNVDDEEDELVPQPTLFDAAAQ